LFTATLNGINNAAYDGAWSNWAFFQSVESVGTFEKLWLSFDVVQG
jgi:hypothetical protein